MTAWKVLTMVSVAAPPSTAQSRPSRSGPKSWKALGSDSQMMTSRRPMISVRTLSAPSPLPEPVMPKMPRWVALRPVSGSPGSHSCSGEPSS